MAKHINKKIASVDIYVGTEFNNYEIGEEITAGKREETIFCIEVQISHGITTVKFGTNDYHEGDGLNDYVNFKEIITTERVDINYEIVEFDDETQESTILTSEE